MSQRVGAGGSHAGPAAATVGCQCEQKFRQPHKGEDLDKPRQRPGVGTTGPGCRRSATESRQRGGAGATPGTSVCGAERPLYARFGLIVYDFRQLLYRFERLSLPAQTIHQRGRPEPRRRDGPFDILHSKLFFISSSGSTFWNSCLLSDINAASCVLMVCIRRDTCTWYISTTVEIVENLQTQVPKWLG